MAPPPSDFADALKKARTAAGLSQAQLAGKAGLTGSYVCLLELRRRPPPSAPVVAALARALSLDVADLQEKADLDRAPEPLRRRIAGLARERYRVRRSRDALLTTTLFHVTRRPGFLAESVAEALGLPEERRLLLGRIAHRVREVPTVEEAASQADDLLKDLPGRERNVLMRALPRLLGPGAGPGEPGAAGAPPDASKDPAWRSVPIVRSPPPPGVDAAASAHDAMHVDRRMHRPGVYVLVADDEDAYPRVERGDHLLVDPAAAPREGDWVVWRDGARAHVRRFRRAGADVRLESPRPDVPPIDVRGDRFAPAGVVTWVFRPLDGAMPLRASARRADDRAG